MAYLILATFVATPIWAFWAIKREKHLAREQARGLPLEQRAEFVTAYNSNRACHRTINIGDVL